MRLLEKNNGFTLVELVIVVTIITTLIASAIFGSIHLSRRAQNARIHNDINVIINGIHQARIDSGQTLLEMLNGVGSVHADCVECACRNQPASVLTNKNSVCWDDYREAIDTINAAADTTVIEGYPQDPWGAPYLINQNEGEHCCCPDNVTWCCTDNITSAGQNIHTHDPGHAYDQDDIIVNLDTYLCSPDAGGHANDQN